MKELFSIFKVFFRIGAFTFGGGYAMIPLIHEEIVDNNGWMNESDFLDAIAISQSLPGAIAINIATFVGYKIKGIKGALVSALGVILPSFLIILFLSGILIKNKDNIYLKKAFLGVRPAIVGLIIFSIYKLQRSVEKNIFSISLYIVSVILLIVLGINPIFVIIASGILGYLYYGGKKK
ncbi:chromate transporter [Helicovermis profundi]|uniref:Chromate transporter n=1 Tax=Helicovermis profundi TaxID=3065157 RepID=A0AAU9E267_9FIRM|nr:chromate transporter [Clostridia bacterium S502]